MNRNRYENLNIKGTVLDNEQLAAYAEKIASDHSLIKTSNKVTYPVPSLEENFKVIYEVYQLLNRDIKLGINIHPAGEWILDNFYVIEEVVKTIRKDLDLKKYRELPGIGNGIYKGFSRVFVVASELVAYTDCKIDEITLGTFLGAYQKRKTLTMEEIWSIPLFIEIALIGQIRMICEKIYVAQIQKYKVENMIERLVENKQSSDQIFQSNSKMKNDMISYKKEMKYPFIEYMSYRLKQYGKQSYPYLKILEEQVEKTGVTVSEVIQKEHFDVATKKVLMGNSITSIKNIPRINFVEIFEHINGIEKILLQDPAGVYGKMDYETKTYYRNKIKSISEKTKISEIYIAKKILELAQNAKIEESSDLYQKKRTHIGYYLISDGIDDLYRMLQVKNRRVSKEKKQNRFVYLQIYIPLLFAIGVEYLLWNKTGHILIAILGSILFYVPLSEIFSQLLAYIMGKIAKPKLIPKLDLEKGIPEEFSTFVVIPTIVKEKEKVAELMNKLEIYYLANKSKNIYFALLGDCSSSSSEKEKQDEELIQEGIRKAEELNQKYSKDENFPKFHFIYRKRLWNEKEGKYLGWERKRGLLAEWNEYLLGKKENTFLVNTMDKQQVPDIKYVITLDSDTDLVLDSALKLVGAMGHILNEPVIDPYKKVVIDGHGMIQPRVGIDLMSVRKSLFTAIFAGQAGTDSYTNAISNLYQDNFEEAIFGGKGIYDVAVFEEVLGNEIPENTVLSHDLLEGNYMRCGLASDIMILDGCPSKYSGFIYRLHRWIRGDWQIAKWLKNGIYDRKGERKENPFNMLSKYKIWDNLRRSLIEITIMLSFLFCIILKLNNSNSIAPFITILLISSTMPMLLGIFNYIVYRQEGRKQQRSFYGQIPTLKATIIKGILELAFLPHRAYMAANAIIKTIYRLVVSKKHLLEWTTAEEMERSSKEDLFSYYRLMSINLLCGAVGLIIFFTGLTSITLFTVSGLWIVAPFLAYWISKPIHNQAKIEGLKEKDKEYLKEVALRTWKFFNEYMNEENNFLPPDNYQADRKMIVANRTSSTNIGLGLLAIVSAYDLGFISKKECLCKLQNTMNTISKLAKWNGHLYNWYYTDTLDPLTPRFISTVDSGNFVGYLFVLKTFLKELNQTEDPQIHTMLMTINKMIEDTDFSVLYNPKTRLFSVGFDLENNLFVDSYYDFLASEARQASLVAIAKRDIPAKHWSNLSRTLTILNKYKGLISWSGTAFEYLMPNINIRKYPGSLLDESSRFLVMSQREYAKKLGLPWGISESAFNLRDLNSNYQYKAFGVPWLGLKRGLADEMVVAPYGSILAVSDYPEEVIQNLKQLEKEGMLGKYGFYEAIDYTSSRLKPGQKAAPVKTYMSHHQGLILLSINNLFGKNILQERFGKNPEIAAIDILLQETMPENVIITKEKKEKVDKIKYIGYDCYSEKVTHKPEEVLNNCNVISNGAYTVLSDDRGCGYSKYHDIVINRYKDTADTSQGIFFYIKNIKSKRLWTASQMKYLSEADKYAVYFAPDHTKIVRRDGNIETQMNISVTPEDPVEIRRLQLKNTGTTEEILEITSLLEPVLSNKMQDYSHMAFNKLFLSYEYDEQTSSMIIKRKQREPGKPEIYLGVNFYTENDTIGELEYEIDKEKLYGRGNHTVPSKIKESKPLSKSLGLVTDPIVALKRTIKIAPESKVVIDLIMTVANSKEEVLEKIEKYQNSNKITKVLALVRAKAEEEARYLEVTGKEIQNYQKVLSYLLLPNKLKSLQMPSLPKRTYQQNELWQFGISGDLPILLVMIKDVNDIHIVEDVLKAYEFYRSKNVKIEVVILNQEKDSYYVAEAIEGAILNRNIRFLKNQYGGIFVLEEEKIGLSIKQMLMFKANLVLEASRGNIEIQLKEQEEEYLSHKREIKEEKAQEIIKPEEENKNRLEPINHIDKLKYYNEFGAFSENGKEYYIKINRENRTPTVWSHVLSNSHFGTVVTENMGGYTWSQNSRLNRISAWANNPIEDIPSEIFYLKDVSTGKVWSMGANPTPDEEDYYITYGFGFAKYKHYSDQIVQEIEMFIPKEDKVKVHLVHLKNTSSERKKLKLVYYIKPVLGEDEIYSNTFINTEKIKNSNVVYSKNLYHSDFKDSIVYVASSENIQSYTGNKDSFLGKGTIQVPEAINKISLDNTNGLGSNSCIAIQMNIELDAYQSKDFSVLLGEETSILGIQDTSYKYSNVNNCKEQLKETKKFWNEIVSSVQVKTPLESMNILLNGWALYQTLACRLWARSGYYQSGGAFGFRDQLQDTIGLKFVNPEFMKDQIIEASKHQFKEGDVEHWWHNETGRGIRTRFSDDLLWLCYVCSEYMDFSGDDSILEIEIPYLEGELLTEGQDEKYDQYLPSDEIGTIYDHCIRAIRRSFQFGENGLPKIGSGDWNDGFSTVGNKGKGESVWLGFFLYRILTKWIPIVKQKGDEQTANEFEQIKESLKRALNTNAWDGRWYKRAFTDDGFVLGSIENEECRIDSIAQSWSIISGAGDNDKKYISLEALENHLVDKENGIIKLLDPPFEKSKLEPGYIKSYLPGVRENGGQYTHAATWAIIAEAMLGFGDKATEFFRMINPIEHTRTREAAQKYKVEPYVIAADIYGANNLAGRGGWTWYTGSSSWIYKTGIELILGLKIEKGYLSIQPSIPKEWEAYSIQYKYQSTIYNIRVKNPERRNTGVSEFKYNGEIIEKKEIKLVDNGRINEIEVIM